MKQQKVALALSTGGARGIAHIGVIEELLRQGYEITSIAGCSMGALVGAAYASGNLDKCKRALYDLNRLGMVKLADIRIMGKGFIKGKKIMKIISDIIPDCNIEDLPIALSLVATDVNNSCEVVSESGSLHEAIRASISLPFIFEPVSKGNMLLIDGGITNPLPLDRVKRTENDLLFGVAVSAPGAFNQPEKGKYSKITLLAESSTLMVQRLISYSIEKNQPDLIIKVPAKEYGVHEFHKAALFVEEGVKAAREVLDVYHAQFIEDKSYIK